MLKISNIKTGVMKYFININNNLVACKQSGLSLSKEQYKLWELC